MTKNLRYKKISQFFKTDIPENIIPTIKIPNKYKQLLGDKRYKLKRIKKRINYIENLYKNEKIVKEKLKEISYSNFINRNKKKKAIRFLYSSEQIKIEILKKENQYRKFSDFLLKLKERKKYSFFYGPLSKKYFKRIYNQAIKKKGSLPKNLFYFFERRLDVLIFRICFAKNIFTAKQYIAHNMVTVNGNYINVPSYQVKAGDIISFDKEKKLIAVGNLKKLLRENLTKRKIRSFFSLNLLKTSLKTKQKKLKLSLKNDYFAKINLLLFYLYNYYKKYSKLRKSKKYLRKIRILKALKKLIVLKEKISILKKIDNYFFNNKKFYNQYLSLYFKQFFYQKKYRNTTLTALRSTAMKPLHIEVSYKLMVAIVLYMPQKIAFPALLETEIFARSF